MAGGMSRPDAMRAAAGMANNFYGGVEKGLRGKNFQNLIKALVLAPDWSESRMRLAGRQYLGAVKTLTLRGTPEDIIYAKSLARQWGMRLVKDLVLVARSGSKYDPYFKGEKPGELAAIQAGKTTGPAPGGGKRRSFPLLGTAAEGVRLPEEIGRMMASGDIGAPLEIAGYRASPISKAFAHLLITHTDEFGNPIWGKSKFGRKIPVGEQIGNIATEATMPWQPQIVQGGIDYLRGKVSGEEALAKGLELPVQYRSPREFGRVRRRGTGARPLRGL
jgi:hypothetical protein